MSRGYKTIYRYVYQGKKFINSLEVTGTRGRSLILVTRSRPIDSESAMDEKVSAIDITSTEVSALIESLTNFNKGQ